MYFLTCFPFQIQVPNHSTVLNFWRKAYFCIASHVIHYLMSEWHDKGAILLSGLKHVLKQGMKIVGVSVNWKWDRLVTYWLALVGSIGVNCRAKIAKIVLIGNPRWRHVRYLENLIFASSPEPKSQLTWNLIGSIGMTCRSKVGKIVLIRNPIWWPAWKANFRLFSRTKRPFDLKLGRKHQGNLQI